MYISYIHNSSIILYVDNSIYIYIYIYIYILTALGLRCCVRAFCSCHKWGLFFIVVRSLLIAVASLVAEHRLWRLGFSSCGVWAQ